MIFTDTLLSILVFVNVVYMFHRIIFILLIVSSPSRNFYRSAGCFQSYIKILHAGVLKCRPQVSLAFNDDTY